MNATIQLEVCVDSIASCVAAEKGGATRVELCDNLFEGGTTPSAGVIRAARQRIGIDLHVMIRPRGGDFFYSDEEFAAMQYDIQVARDLGANGVVFGLLLPDGSVDSKRTAELTALARPLRVTFHRAFDMTADPIRSLHALMDLGIDFLLTSGQEKSVLEGAELIAQLVKLASNRIRIMPGGGITERNLVRIIRETGVRDIHLASTQMVGSPMLFRNPRVYMGGQLHLPEYELAVTDAEKIATLQNVMNEFIS